MFVFGFPFLLLSSFSSLLHLGTSCRPWSFAGVSGKTILALRKHCLANVILCFTQPPPPHPSTLSPPPVLSCCPVVLLSCCPVVPQSRYFSFSAFQRFSFCPLVV